MQSPSKGAFNPFKRLENPAYIKERLSYFENTKWRVSDMDKLQDEYGKSIGFVGADYLVLQKGATLYRASENKEEALFATDKDTSALFQTVGRLGINSRERTTEFGRANLPLKPAFYACPDFNTAIHEKMQWVRNEKQLDDFWFKRQGFVGKTPMEISAEANSMKVLTISAWEVQEDMRLAFFLDKENLTPEMRKAVEWELANNALLRGPGAINIIKSMDLIRNFFIKQFIKMEISSQEDYMLSAMCADYMYRLSGAVINGHPSGVGGIMYSSVAEGFKGINIALAEDVILKNKVKFVSAKLYAFSPLRSGLRNGWQAVGGSATCVSEETGQLVWTIGRGSDM